MTYLEIECCGFPPVGTTQRVEIFNEGIEYHSYRRRRNIQAFQFKRSQQTGLTYFDHLGSYITTPGWPHTRPNAGEVRVKIYAFACMNMFCTCLFLFVYICSCLHVCAHWVHNACDGICRQIGETFEVKIFDGRVRYSRTSAAEEQPQTGNISAVAVAVPMAAVAGPASVIAAPMETPRPLEDPAAIIPVVTAVDGPKLTPKFCSQCGAKTVGDQKFCSNCGYKF